MDNGIKIENMDLVPLSILIIKDMKEIGWMERNMEKEFITIKMEINILEIGWEIGKMAEEF